MTFEFLRISDSILCSRDDVQCSSYDEDVYMASVSEDGVFEIHHGDVLVTSQQLAGQRVDTGNVLTCGCVDGAPCVVVATCGEGRGVYILHALTGELMRSLPFREGVYGVCIDRSSTLVVFGTQSGLWFPLSCIHSQWFVQV